jgi:hypothetical protein
MPLAAVGEHGELVGTSGLRATRRCCPLGLCTTRLPLVEDGEQASHCWESEGSAMLALLSIPAVFRIRVKVAME